MKELVKKIPPDARKWLRLLLILYLIFIVFTLLWNFYGRRIESDMGDAKWIWTWNEMKADEPEAFFATRNFILPERRAFTRIRIAADPLYTLYFNEVEVGDGGWSLEPGIDEWDVSDLAVSGVNRIVVAVRSPRGVGGLIVSVGITPLMQGLAATGPEWKIHDEWTSTLLAADTNAAVTPRVLGAPPYGRWDYPEVRSRERRTGALYVHDPGDGRIVETARPVVRHLSGVPIAGIEPEIGTAFDFGRFVSGRIALEMAGHRDDELVRLRYGSEPGHMSGDVSPIEIAMAPGERRITVPGERGFRYLTIFRDDVDVSVVSPHP